MVNIGGNLSYDFVTKRDTDTYGDIKDELLPLIQLQLERTNVDLRLRLRRQLVLPDDDIHITRSGVEAAKNMSEFADVLNQHLNLQRLTIEFSSYATKREIEKSLKRYDNISLRGTGRPIFSLSFIR